MRILQSVQAIPMQLAVPGTVSAGPDCERKFIVMSFDIDSLFKSTLTVFAGIPNHMHEG